MGRARIAKLWHLTKENAKQAMRVRLSGQRKAAQVRQVVREKVLTYGVIVSKTLSKYEVSLVRGLSGVGVWGRDSPYPIKSI
jgi:hypothetical protein